MGWHPQGRPSRVCWDDCWEGTSWLPPEAREEAAGLEVVDLGLGHDRRSAGVQVGARPSRPAFRHIADS